MSHASSSTRPLGAVPVKNAKGEMTMQKVKVQRYISGRKPNYASSSEEGESSDDEIHLQRTKPLLNTTTQRGTMAFSLSKRDEVDDDDDEDDVRMSSRKNKESYVHDEKMKQDPRMRRLIDTQKDSSDEDDDLPSRRGHRGDDARRPVSKPQLLEDDDMDIESDDDEVVRRRRRHREVIDAEADDEEANEDENIERRHELLKQRLEKVNIEPEEEGGFEGDEEDEEDEESEYEEYSDSEEEGLPRLKPIFVSKKDRITIIEKEEEEERRLAQLEAEKKLVAEERKRTTMKIIENDRRRDEEEEAQNKWAAEEEAIIKGIAAILTDDEDGETGFELWKVRELKRIKREKEEEEARDKERSEIERLRNMTEEERQAELEANPRIVTNQADKGKYRFMQKYFHRGVFFLDQEDDVFKRDFAQPTLEDHFNKTSLPAVLQVKNFGRAGRTKYTHLVDQDTTAFDHAWGDKNNTSAIKFHGSHGGGMKQVFEKPGNKKQKKS